MLTPPLRVHYAFVLQWFAKTRRQAQLALSRAKSVNYNPLEDPKYSFSAPEEDEDEEEEDEEE